MKFVANLLVAIHNVSAAEAFVLGMKAGLPAKTIFEVIDNSAGTSRMFQVRGPQMVKGRYDDAGMKVELWQKDMKIIGEFAARSARRRRCSTPPRRSTTRPWRRAMRGEDTAAVCAVLESMARLRRGSDFRVSSSVVDLEGFLQRGVDAHQRGVGQVVALGELRAARHHDDPGPRELAAERGRSPRSRRCRA